MSVFTKPASCVTVTFDGLVVAFGTPKRDVFAVPNVATIHPLKEV